MSRSTRDGISRPERAERDNSMRASPRTAARGPGEQATASRAGRTIAAAGLIGSATLSIPLTAALALPGSAAVPAPGPAILTAHDVFGPGTQFRACTAVRPAAAQPEAPGGTAGSQDLPIYRQSQRHLKQLRQARSNAPQPPAAPGRGRSDRAGGQPVTATLTAYPPGGAASGRSPLPSGQAGGTPLAPRPSAARPPRSHHGHRHDRWVYQPPREPRDFAVTAAPVPPASPAVPVPPTATAVPAPPTGTAVPVPPTGTAAPGPAPAPGGSAPVSAVPVSGTNGNALGSVLINHTTGTAVLVSPGGTPLGTVQSDPLTGNLLVVGASGAVLGGLGLNPASGAIVLMGVPVAQNQSSTQGQILNQLVPDPGTPPVADGIYPNQIPANGGSIPGGTRIVAGGVTYNIPYDPAQPIQATTAPTIIDGVQVEPGQTITFPPGTQLNLGRTSTYIPGNRDLLQLPDGTYYVGLPPAPGQPDTRTQVIIQTTPPPGVPSPGGRQAPGQQTPQGTPGQQGTQDQPSTPDRPSTPDQQGGAAPSGGVATPATPDPAPPPAPPMTAAADPSQMGTPSALSPAPISQEPAPLTAPTVTPQMLSPAPVAAPAPAPVSPVPVLAGSFGGSGSA